MRKLLAHLPKTLKICRVGLAPPIPIKNHQKTIGILGGKNKGVTKTDQKDLHLENRIVLLANF